MNSQKKHIFKFLFLVYFLFYVVSPLCYAKERLNEGDVIAHTTKHETKNIRVIWELILSKLFQQDNTEDNPSNVHFFIKKARAVLGSNNITKIAQSESAISSLNEFSPPEESLIPLFQPIDLKPQDGIYSVSSGRSPPSV